MIRRRRRRMAGSMRGRATHVCAAFLLLSLVAPGQAMQWFGVRNLVQRRNSFSGGAPFEEELLQFEREHVRYTSRSAC